MSDETTPTNLPALGPKSPVYSYEGVLACFYRDALEPIAPASGRIGDPGGFMGYVYFPVDSGRCEGIPVDWHPDVIALDFKDFKKSHADLSPSALTLAFIEHMTTPQALSLAAELREAVRA